MVGELGERAVQPDCLVRVVVDRRPDQEDADQPEDDHAREMAESADPVIHVRIAGPICSVFESFRKSLLSPR